MLPCGVPTAMKNCFRLLDAVGKVGGELDAAVEVLGEHVGQVLFIDRHAALVEHFDFGFVVVDADDFVTDFSETNGSDQADVA